MGTSNGVCACATLVVSYGVDTPLQKNRQAAHSKCDSWSGAEVARCAVAGVVPAVLASSKLESVM